MTARERRFVAAGGLCAAAFLVVQCGLRPLVDGQLAVRAELAEKRELLERYRRILETKRRYGQRYGDVRQAAAALEARFIPDPKPSVGVALLQGAVQRRAEAAGLEISGARFLPPRGTGAFVQVGVELSAKGRLEGLVRFLEALERDERLLTVPRLTVAGIPPDGRGLTITIEVDGFVRAAGPAGGSGAPGRPRPAPRSG
jgi:hypothetical protein